MLDLDKIKKFQWDKGNKNKNWAKHKVADEECEEVFFDLNKKIFKDILHSVEEDRYILIGKTKLKRLLFVVFTIRRNKIRIISTRGLNKKERGIYYEKKS